MFRFLDRISRPKPPQKRPRRRRARLRFILLVRHAALSLLAAGAVLGAGTLAAVMFAPDWVRSFDPQLRDFYWRDVYAHAEELRQALNSGKEATAIDAGRRLFAAGKGVRFNEAPMAILTDVTEVAFGSRIPQLRREAARYVTNLSPNDSYAWHVLGEESRREGRVDEAEKAFLRALELRPYSYPTAAALIALYEKSGYPDRAKAVHQRFRQGVNMLLGVGTSFEAILSDGNGASVRSLIWFDGCRPNRIEIGMPPETKTGFLALPPAAGAEISLTAVTALTDDGEAAQRWTAYFGSQFLPVANGYRIALGRDASFVAQAVIGLAASEEGVPATKLRFDFSMCLPDSVDPLTQPVSSDLVWQGHGQGQNRALISLECQVVDQDVSIQFPVTDIYVVLPMEEVVMTIRNGVIVRPDGGPSIPIVPRAVSHALPLGDGIFKSVAKVPAKERAVIGLHTGTELPAGTSFHLRVGSCPVAEYERRQ